MVRETAHVLTEPAWWHPGPAAESATEMAGIAETELVSDIDESDVRLLEQPAGFLQANLVAQLAVTEVDLGKSSLQGAFREAQRGRRTLDR